MRTHIKVVGLVNLLYSAVGLLVAVGALFGGLFSSLASLNPAVMIVGSVTSAIVAVVIGVISLLGLIAGLALLNHQNWARWVILACSALRVFRWPFGTLFGIYSIWVLTHQETRDIFAINN